MINIKLWTQHDYLEIGISLIYLIFLVRFIKSSVLSLMMKLVILIQTTLLYLILVIVLFGYQQFWRLTLMEVILLQALWNQILVEYFEQKIQQIDNWQETEQLRRRFGLGNSHVQRVQENVSKPIIFYHVGLICYYIFSSYILGYSIMETRGPSIFYIGVFLWYQIFKGSPCLVEIFIGRLISQKEDDLQLKFVDQDSESLLMWGQGKYQLPKTQTSRFKDIHIHKLVCQVLDYLFFWGTFLIMIFFALGFFFNFPHFDSWQYIHKAILPQGGVMTNSLEFLVKVGLVVQILYLGNRVPNKRKDELRQALEGSKHLCKMLVCSIVLLVLYYPSMMLNDNQGKPTPIGEFTQSILERKDMRLLYLCTLLYMLVYILIKFTRIVQKK